MQELQEENEDDDQDDQSLPKHTVETVDDDDDEESQATRTSTRMRSQPQVYNPSTGRSCALFNQIDEPTMCSHEEALLLAQLMQDVSRAHNDSKLT